MSVALLPHARVVEVADPTTEYAGRMLAEVGAEVFLVEPPGGAVTRRRRPHVTGADETRRSIPFLARNADKRSVVLDSTVSEHVRRFQALVRARGRAPRA